MCTDRRRTELENIVPRAVPPGGSIVYLERGVEQNETRTVDETTARKRLFAALVTQTKQEPAVVLKALAPFRLLESEPPPSVTAPVRERCGRHWHPSRR